MPTKSTVCLITLLLLLSSQSVWGEDRIQAPAQQIILPGTGLRNLYRVDEGVYRSEQPDAADFKALEGYGIREVLSLRNWHDDLEQAHHTSLLLHQLPTRASKINEYDLVQALRVIHRRNGPIVIHCWHGSDRTGAVVAMYRIVFQGWTKAAAIDEMTNGGFGFHWQFRQIIDVINRADIPQIAREVGIVYSPMGE